MDQAAQPILQHRRIEVHQQTKPDTTQPEIGQQLRLMQREQLFDSLQFQNKLTTDHHIHPVSRLDPNSLVHHGKQNLALIGDASFPQFVAKSLLIGRLQQTRTKMPMHIHRQADNALAQRPARLPQILLLPASVSLW